MLLKEKKVNVKTTLFVLLFLFSFNFNNALAQIPASLEKEIDQYNTEIYEGLKLLKTQPEKDAIAELAILKPKLRAKAQSLLPRMNAVPEMSEVEEEAYLQEQMAKPIYKDLVVLLNDAEFKKKVSGNPALQKEFDDLMELMDMGHEEETVALTDSQVCSFSVGKNSPNSGSYVVTALEGNAFAYDDTENELFIIEIIGDNYIDIMLIIEEPITGKHTFSMEMQVAIDLSKNNGDDYISFDNYLEEGGGYIKIDRIDDVGGMVSGSFSGKFNDSSTDDDIPVQIEGKFTVKRM